MSRIDRGLGGLQQMRGWVERKVAGRTLREHADADQQPQNAVQRGRMRGGVTGDVFDIPRRL
jgi:hypothetical protein